jgi:hypothetical protein
VHRKLLHAVYEQPHMDTVRSQTTMLSEVSIAPAPDGRQHAPPFKVDLGPYVETRS